MGFLQSRKVLAGPFFDPASPGIDGRSRAFGRRKTCDTFANDQADNFGKRRFVSLTSPRKRTCAEACFESGGKIGSHALHGPRADRLYPRLFSRVEYRRGIGRRRPG